MLILCGILSILIGILFFVLFKTTNFSLKDIFKIKKVKTYVVYSEQIENGDDDSSPVYYNQYIFNEKDKVSDISNKKLTINDSYQFYVKKENDKYEIVDGYNRFRKFKNLIFSMFFIFFGILILVYKFNPELERYIENTIFIPGGVLLLLSFIISTLVNNSTNESNKDYEFFEARVVDFEIHYNDYMKMWTPIFEYFENGERKRYSNNVINSNYKYRKNEKDIIKIEKKVIKEEPVHELK